MKRVAESEIEQAAVVGQTSHGAREEIGHENYVHVQRLTAATTDASEHAYVTMISAHTHTIQCSHSSQRINGSWGERIEERVGQRREREEQ